MFLSKRSHEGYLLIDHRAGDGLDKVPLPANSIAVSGGSVFESATSTCSHCQQVVVLRPDRSRSRGYCPKCDHYVCDGCEAARVQTGICKTFKQIADEEQERGLRLPSLPATALGHAGLVKV